MPKNSKVKTVSLSNVTIERLNHLKNWLGVDSDSVILQLALWEYYDRQAEIKKSMEIAVINTNIDA